MREMQIGLRIDPEAGISFYGLDEVNALLHSGATIQSLEPGGAVMTKQGENSESVRLRLSGFYVKVLLDEGASPDVPRETD